MMILQKVCKIDLCAKISYEPLGGVYVHNSKIYRFIRPEGNEISYV